jgi:predicted DsbA family dithiol-disulfide isomerase
LAAEAGLDAAEAGRVLDGEAFADAVAADEREARELGATGVPFFVIADRYAVSGAQPAELFAEALNRAWSETAQTAV